MYDVLRADRCISVNSLEARVPFGDLRVFQVDGILIHAKYSAGHDPLAAESGVFRRRGPLDGGRSESLCREPVLRR